ncbi:3-oxoacyl-[acyl-carrier-protein] reductase FabG-like [Asterias rubens]|uniref:3-oxoacyl-[acyl-carrier-protein] reductase FabG-like n=1 Tax=Asterias rubens TaxID=7604 RepID=UPI0014554B8F|nr:3-oxoacyl-[acyl-carrier-protein] reductase FabG-like [Asterias rubens]
MAAPMSLAGKVAIVTGASSGIGWATSVLFAKLGAKLSVAGRNESNLDKVAKLCQENGSETLVVVGDVTKEDDNKNLIEKTVQKFGKLDILVNCAGIISLGTIETTSMEAYDSMMNANVRAVFHLTSLAVPHLVKTKGNVVNVSSVNGLRAFPGVLAYCMSKAALDQFTKVTALELASQGVRVNSVNPGVIVTNLQKRGGLDDEAYAKLLERSKTTHALGRPGEPDEAANAIAFLASDASTFITGANLPVDGGRHAMSPR